MGNDRCISRILLASSSFYVSYCFNFANCSLLIVVSWFDFYDSVFICRDPIDMVVTHHYKMFSF